MRYTVGLFFVLSAFWLINSPNENGLLLFLGLVSVLLVLLITHRMKLLDEESFPLHLFIKILPFYGWLIKEMVLGSIYVLKKIVRRDKSLEAKIITIKLNFKNELSTVIFANSITLVPGTLSVELSEGEIQVHALSQELADDLTSGELMKKIKRLEE